MSKHLDELDSVLYCVSGYIEDHNNRNYGDADQWLRHIRSGWEDFIEAHPDSKDPLEYIRSDRFLKNHFPRIIKYLSVAQCHPLTTKSEEQEIDQLMSFIENSIGKHLEG